jgi:hypothetical protein
MSAAIDAFGVFSGLLGVVSFAQSLFPAFTGSSTRVRIAAGLDGTQGLRAAGGGIKRVAAWDYNQNQVGETIASDSWNTVTGTMNYGIFGVPEGNFVDIDVPLGWSNKQTPFIVIDSGRQGWQNSDAICIAYVSTTWADGAQYGWIGNWGRECGLEWYYSGIYVGVSFFSSLFKISHGENDELICINY